MSLIPGQCSVLIVGAGPSGLMMAAQLLRNGVHPLIIDRKTRPSQSSKALTVQARTLEIFRQMGLDQSAIVQGNVISQIQLHNELNHSANEVSTLELSSSGEQKSHFPYMLVLEQYKTERLLIDYLTINTCPIYWNTELLDLSLTDENVTTNVKRNDHEQTIQCDWLIAADGAHSKVASTLPVSFSAAKDEHRYYAADIQVNLDSGKEAIHFFSGDQGFAACYPMQSNSLRCTGMVPAALRKNDDLSFADLKPYLTFTLGVSVQNEQCTWFSTYPVRRKTAENFSIQRCFLIGDAAHVHTPIGGQGMNAGLQDAANLAWKLAGVIKERYSSKILKTYHQERRPIARQISKTADRVFNTYFSSNWFSRNIRRYFASAILGDAGSQKHIHEKTLRFISQAAQNYRSAGLSVHHSQSKLVRAGDRLPYLKLFDEKLNEETDLHSWCSGVGFTLLVIGHLNERDLFLLAKWIKQTYPFDLNFYYLPPSDRNQHVLDAFEISKKQRRALIVRPDLHIGYLNDAVVIDMLDTYLKETVGWR
ncbi:FAD-dependent monooxygenase [Desertivirga xinjiangensis]|uniref:FAD-dependent monooxygenase n=1 Tax=Desertivirga xinjiangensis TaxID=539206 RepID=UPI00210D7156|nr:FAD-dependent monooxygenase [Pedobacter xinjiangensis]